MWMDTCPACEGTSLTNAGLYLESLVHLLLIYGENAGVAVGDMAELTTGLCERAPHPVIGHDAIDRWTAVNKIKQAAGIPQTWGLCPICRGAGKVPAAEEK